MAETAMSDAQKRIAWAISKNAENNYPEHLNSANIELLKAKKYYNEADYLGSSDAANKVMDILSEVREFAPLPARYIVRLIPGRSDCFWRIAEYPYVYNDPLKWPELYEANKKILKDPSNPDLIYPGDVLVIPAIADEIREGTWDPKKTYQIFKHK
jgi:nucleoid-associated protein YgaU